MGTQTTLLPKRWMVFLLPAVWLKDGISLKGAYALKPKISSILFAFLLHIRDTGKLEYQPVIFRLFYQIIIFNSFFRRNIPIINSEYSYAYSRHIKYHFPRTTLNSLFLLNRSHSPPTGTLSGIQHNIEASRA